MRGALVDESSAIELARHAVDGGGVFMSSESSVAVRDQGDAWVVTFSPRQPESQRIEDFVLGGPGAKVTVGKTDGSTSVVYTQ